MQLFLGILQRFLIAKAIIYIRKSIEKPGFY